MWRLRRRIHSAWLIALTCAAFVAGVAAALVVYVPWLLGLVSLVCIMSCLYVRWVALVVPLIVAGAVVGASYGSAHLGARAVYRQWIEQSVVLKGRVKEDPSRTASGSVSLQLDGVVINGVSTPGTVYVSIRGSTLPKRGDILTIRGTLREGFGSFAASLTGMGVVAMERPIPGDIGRVIRDWFAEQVREKISEPQASLGIGFLTGQKSALPDDLSDALKIAGLTHIVVASGYNLTILVRMARKLLLNVSKFLSTVSAVGMIVFFVAITGLSPSMTRAGLVSSMSLMAWYYGRAFHPFVLLPLAAAITVIMQPSYVWGDLGWQLSFAAFAGVMIVAPLVQRYFFGEKEPGVFRQVFGETIAAHLVTVPIIALSFGTISHVAIIANLLVVPLVPLAMLLTFIVGILAIANVPLSMLIAEPASWLLGYMVTVARFVSELEWAQSELTIPSWWWIVYVALIGGMCVWIWKVTRFRFGATEPLY